MSHDYHKVEFHCEKEKWQNVMMPLHLVPSYLTDYHRKPRGSSVLWGRDLLATTGVSSSCACPSAGLKFEFQVSICFILSGFEGIQVVWDIIFSSKCLRMDSFFLVFHQNKKHCKSTIWFENYFLKWRFGLKFFPWTTLSLSNVLFPNRTVSN